jgi:acetyltransferase-like isoleucine patch superfamily enzyme
MKRTWRNLTYTIWDLFWIFWDRFISTACSRLSLSIQGCSYGKGFMTTGACSFKARTEKSILLGKNVSLLAGWRSNRVGLSGMVLLQTLGKGHIEIGDGSGGSSVTLSSRSRISIGQNVCLGGNVRVLDHDFHALDHLSRRLAMDEQQQSIRTQPIVIGDDVFIGTNAIILKGVTLGDRCIVAAGAVVFRGNYPPDCIISGNPAVVMRQKGKGNSPQKSAKDA